MNKKIKYIAVNVIAPGIGLLAMKKWCRGLIYFLGSATCLVCILIAFTKNVIGLYYIDMDTDSSMLDPVRLLISIFLPLGLLILLWFSSYVDLCFFCKLEPKIKSGENNDK